MKNDEEKYSLCALNRIFGFEPKIAHALISHIGSASGVFCLSERETDSLLGPWSRYKGQICRQALEEAAEEVERLKRAGISFIGMSEDDYPGILAECEDAPIGLYIRSTTPPSELFAPERKIAVVGTRDISPYGTEWCSRIVQGLGRTREKPLIVSGLALGTDICAHKAAIENGLPTIAVMATGPESVYPYRHKEFAERIAGTPGCALITDYPPGTAPLAIHFLRRNRIIAGLSDGLILVESKIKGGGMMTSRLAFSYNREVYALPGRVDDICSQGCNMLIRTKMAEPIVSAEALNDSLRLNSCGNQRKASHADTLYGIYGNTQSNETLGLLLHITDLIGKERGITLDEMTFRTGLEYAAVSHLTGLLESEGLISIDILQRCSLEAGKFR
jgi:DNA processing protein